MRNQVLIWRIVAIATILIIGSYTLVSQSAPPLQPPAQSSTIRINSNLIQVPVGVTDYAGNPVKTLRAGDFLLEENGASVPIAHMGEPGEARLDLALIFDNTGSVFARFDFEREAAKSFLHSVLRPGDSVAILTIASTPFLLLDRTNSLAVALDGLEKLKASDVTTAFFDTVVKAARLFQGASDPGTRRVQVVLSDGEDNSSELKLSDALREVQQSDCIFYSVNPGGPSIRLNNLSLRGQSGMEALATETGGVAFLAETLDELPKIYGRIASELQAQYLLSYYSPDLKLDGRFRQIAVRIPSRPDLRVRARQGYYAGKPASR
jgi:Ca-activated chloride channel family protein